MCSSLSVFGWCNWVSKLINRSRDIILWIFKTTTILKLSKRFYSLFNSSQTLRLKTCVQTFDTIDPSVSSLSWLQTQMNICSLSPSKRMSVAALAQLISTNNTNLQRNTNTIHQTGTKTRLPLFTKTSSSSVLVYVL